MPLELPASVDRRGGPLGATERNEHIYIARGVGKNRARRQAGQKRRASTWREAEANEAAQRTRITGARALREGNSWPAKNEAGSRGSGRPGASKSPIPGESARRLLALPQLQQGVDRAPRADEPAARQLPELPPRLPELPKDPAHGRGPARARYWRERGEPLRGALGRPR